MNKFSFFGIAMLALTALVFSGCSKVDDLNDFEFHSDFDESIAVADPTPNGTNVTYKEDITVDATADSQVERYKSKIKSFKIDKISYTIDNTGNSTKGAKFTGILGFSDKDGGSATVLTTLTDVDLDDHTTVHEITLSEADLAKVAGYLNTNHAFKIYVDGKVSKTPISVVVDIKVAVTVTAKAI